MHHEVLQHGVRSGWRTRPRLLHRLDQPVSGLLMYAKTVNAFRFARQMMEHHRFMRKQYIAVVTGRPSVPIGELTCSYIKSPDRLRYRFASSGRRKATTRYETLASFRHPHLGAVSVLRLSLGTGRQHQLRATCEALGCPIVGDPLYGGHEWPVTMLHAARIAFDTPTARTYDVRAAPPAEWRSSVDAATDWRDRLSDAGVELPPLGQVS